MSRFLVTALVVLFAVPAATADAQSHRQKSSFVIVASGATAVDGTATRLLLDLKDGPAPKRAKSVLGFGHGAASLLVSQGTDGQTARGHAYYDGAKLNLRLTYTTTAADAEGSSTVTGTGTLTGHGGTFAKARGTFDVTGTQDASGLTKLRIAGKVSYKPVIVPVGSGRGH